MKTNNKVNYTLKQNLNKIRRYTNDKRFHDSFKLLDDLSEEFSNNPYYIFEMGYYYYSLHNYDKALEYFERLRNSKNKYHAIYYIGIIKFKKGDQDGAICEFEIIIASNHQEKAYAKIELAEIYKYRLEYDKAIEILSNVIDEAIINNDQRVYIVAMISKAEALLGKEEYTMACNLINSIIGKIKRRDLLDKALNVLASIEYENDNFENCQKYLNKISNANMPKMLLEAKILYKQNKNYESKAICKLLYSTYGFTLGVCSLNSKNNIRLKLYDEAKQELEIAIKANKNNEALYYDFGLLYFQKQDFGKSLEYFDYVIKNIVQLKYLSILKSIYANIKLNRMEDAFNLYSKYIKSGIFDIDANMNDILNVYFKNYIDNYQECTCRFYSYNQMKNYSDELAIRHIYDHHNSNQIDSKRHTLFSNEIDIRELFNYARNNISTENFFDNNFFDEYIIEYNKCNIDIDDSTNKLKVITIPNTNDIITMYPLRNYNNIKKEDEFKSKPYIKISQIDKFKKRYGFN